MPKKILVATPHPAFGELLRISLEENGPYQVRLVQSGKEAQASIARNAYALAILDCDLSDPDMPVVARELLERIPEMRLMVIPLENDGKPIHLDGIRVDGMVTRPYYLPDLLDTVQNLLTPPPLEIQPVENPALEAFQWQPDVSAVLPWQRDAGKAAAQLGDLIKDCSADSLVIARLRNLYAFRGRLNSEGAQLIANELARYWDGSQKSDLVRFLSHESPEQDSLLYATALADEFILALIYDVPIPLTRCRAQAGKLVRLLMTPAEAGEILPPAVDQVNIIAQMEQAPVALEPLENILVAAVGEPAPGGLVVEEEEQAISELNEEAMAANLASLLAVMPQPDPTLAVEPAVGGQPPIPEKEFRFPWELTEMHDEPSDSGPTASTLTEKTDLPGWITSGGEPEHSASEQAVEEFWGSGAAQSAENEPGKEQPAGLATFAEVSDTARELEAADTQPYRVKRKTQETAVLVVEAGSGSPPAQEEGYQKEPRQARTARAPSQRADAVMGEDTFLEDTHPRRARRPIAVQTPSQEAALPNTAPLPPAKELPGGLFCTCVLIPFVPEHYLAGGIADLVKQSLVKLAAQNHWKVSRVLVRPQYLQWTTETPEAILPDKVAERIRKSLSGTVFKQNPALKKQNRSGNFWSADFLALQGSEPPPPQRLRAFTRQVRAQSENPVKGSEKP